MSVCSCGHVFYVGVVIKEQDCGHLAPRPHEFMAIKCFPPGTFER